MSESRIEIVLGDITKQSYDAVVNAANKSLLGGGGVDGAIHRAAGPQLLQECKELQGCDTGAAKVTKSYDLSRNNVWYIIHAVGPRWFGGVKNEDKLLEGAYSNSLRLAVSINEIYPQQCVDILRKYIGQLKEDEQSKLIEEVRQESEVYVKSHPIKTIAFPSISTGIYRFPLERAAAIAVRSMKCFLEGHKEIEKLGIVCFDIKTYEAYNKAVLEYQL